MTIVSLQRRFPGERLFCSGRGPSFITLLLTLTGIKRSVIMPVHSVADRYRTLGEGQVGCRRLHEGDHAPARVGPALH